LDNDDARTILKTYPWSDLAYEIARERIRRTERQHLIDKALGKVEEEEYEEPDYTEAVYDCLCAIEVSLRRIADKLSPETACTCPGTL